MNDPISNKQKQMNYQEQFRRLKSALNNGFNLEAMFIEYAIMEDRTESILRHAEKWDAYLKRQKGRNPTIDSKIRYIQNLADNNKDLLNRYFSDNLLSEILQWKEERNRLIHALLKQHLTDEEVIFLAQKGNDLVKLLRTKATNYNRSIERKKQSSSSWNKG